MVNEKLFSRINTCNAVERKLEGTACAMYKQKKVQSVKTLPLCRLICSGWIEFIYSLEFNKQRSPEISWLSNLSVVCRRLKTIGIVMRIGDIFTPTLPCKDSTCYAYFSVKQCIKVLNNLIILCQYIFPSPVKPAVSTILSINEAQEGYKA